MTLTLASTGTLDGFLLGRRCFTTQVLLYAAPSLCPSMMIVLRACMNNAETKDRRAGEMDKFQRGWNRPYPLSEKPPSFVSLG